MREKDNHMRVLKHYANFHGCYELVEEAEEQLQARFDWVLTVRADVAIYGSIVPYCLWDTEHVHVAPSPTYGEKAEGWRRPPDGSPEGLRWQAAANLESALSEPVLIVPRQMARRVLQRPAVIFSSALVGDAVCRDKSAHIPEAFLAKVFRLEGVDIRFAAIPAVIVRGSADSGAQCAGWGSVTHGMSSLERDCRRFVYQQQRHGTSSRLAHNYTATRGSRSSSYVNSAWSFARESSEIPILLVSLSFAPYAILLAVRCAGWERCGVRARATV